MESWKEAIHPGEILADELEELGLTGASLATRIGVPNNRIYQIMCGKRSVTADTALRLGHFFGTSAEFWLNLQKSYELDIARDEADLSAIIPYQTEQVSNRL